MTDYEITAGMDIYDRKTGRHVGTVVEPSTTGKNPTWKVERFRDGRDPYIHPHDEEYIRKYFAPQPVDGGLFGT